MNCRNRWLVLGLVVAGLQLSACEKKSSLSSKNEPAKVEPVQGTQFSRVILTAQAAQRLGIETAPVRETRVPPQPGSREHSVLRMPVESGLSALPGGSGAIVPVKQNGAEVSRKVIPYAAVLYDTQGVTWVYTNPKPLVFLRHRIIVDYIDGELAVLSEGPPAGTNLVTVGASEIYGTEFKVGH